VGLTVVVPKAVDVLKDPGVIAIFVTVPVAFHESVDVPADATMAGAAEKEVMVGGRPESVVPLVLVLCAEMLPTPSYAATAYQYVVDVARFVSVYAVDVVIVVTMSTSELDDAPR